VCSSVIYPRVETGVAMDPMQNTAELDAFAVPILEERPWVVFSACRDADPSIFFGSTREEIQQALALCAVCPVRSECLEHALEARERFGVWGGTTESERRKILRRIA